MLVTTVDGNEHDLTDYYFAGVMDGQIMFNFKVASEVTDKGIIRNEGVSFNLNDVQEVYVED